MDIRKILSRGTKRTPSQAFDIKSHSKPSSPQLYNDPIRGVKRKRQNEQPAEQNGVDEGVEDLDFFASKEPQKRSAQRVPEPAPIQKPQFKALDEEQVRQILKSHRLRFTLLSSHETEARVKKSRKNDLAKAKEGAKRQLFPQPLTSFSQLRSNFNISSRLATNLATQGYRIPTEVQLGSLPLLIDPQNTISPTVSRELGFDTSDGVHFLAVAPTGSGKTLAFLIPAMNSILRRRAAEKEHVLDALIVVPTRELLHQIVNEGRKLAQGTGIKVVGMKAGMRLPVEGDILQNMTEGNLEREDESDEEDIVEEDEAERATTTTKADLLVTTPTLLTKFLRSRSLPTVRSLILDEMDLLLDTFRDQTIAILSACTHPALRLSCYSATVAASIEALILDRLRSRDPSSSTVPLLRLIVGLKDTAVPSIKHQLVYTATEQGKLFALRQLLHPKSSNASAPAMRLPFLVFTQSIERAITLYQEIKFEFSLEAGGASRIAALHSSLSASDRSRIVADFRAGETWVLITTDILMRGIDFIGVNGVINYDVPTSTAAYVHRVGRTGRAGHEGGVAVTFYTTEDVNHLKSVANVISLSQKQAGEQGEKGVPKWLLESLPKVTKDEKKKLKERGVESRRGAKGKITSKSAWERRKENNMRGAIMGSKKRKSGQKRDDTQDDESEWGGIDD